MTTDTAAPVFGFRTLACRVADHLGDCDRCRRERLPWLLRMRDAVNLELALLGYEDVTPTPKEDAIQ